MLTQHIVGAQFVWAIITVPGSQPRAADVLVPRVQKKKPELARWRGGPGGRARTRHLGPRAHRSYQKQGVGVCTPAHTPCLEK